MKYIILILMVLSISTITFCDVERWAMIKDRQGINVILWDGDYNTWQPPNDVIMILDSKLIYDENGNIDMGVIIK